VRIRRALVHFEGPEARLFPPPDRPMPHKHNADRRHHIPKMVFKGHRQLDRPWPSYACEQYWEHARLRHSGSTAHLGPRPEGLGPGSSILMGRKIIAAEMEESVDLIMGREEVLRLPR
jgi:hypothetical protein